MDEDLELRTNNPYSVGSIFVFGDGTKVLDREPIEPIPSIRDRYHTVKDGDNLSILAFQKYGDSKEWWVIADSNKIEWPFELTTGTTLLIPDLDKVKIQM